MSVLSQGILAMETFDKNKFHRNSFALIPKRFTSDRVSRICAEKSVGNMEFALLVFLFSFSRRSSYRRALE